MIWKAKLAKERQAETVVLQNAMFPIAFFAGLSATN
jgi:hypothetical protein